MLHQMLNIVMIQPHEHTYDQVLLSTSNGLAIDDGVPSS